MATDPKSRGLPEGGRGDAPGGSTPGPRNLGSFEVADARGAQRLNWPPPSDAPAPADREVPADQPASDERPAAARPDPAAAPAATGPYLAALLSGRRGEVTAPAPEATGPASPPKVPEPPKPIDRPPTFEPVTVKPAASPKPPAPPADPPDAPVTAEPVPPFSMYADRETSWSRPKYRSWRIEHVALLALAAIAILEAALIVYLWRSGRGDAPPANSGSASASAPQTPAPDAAPAPAAPVTGRLVVGQAGTRVFVDGVAEGRTPVATYDLPPGEHEVRLETPSGIVRRSVRIAAGEETALPVPTTPAQATPPAAAASAAAPSTGWLRVSAPVEMQMFEGDRFLGTSRVDRMLVEAGDRSITLVSDAVGYRETHRVTVKPGAATDLRISLPSGRLSVNAVPWANVFVDGEPAGETPIGNLEVASGPHEIRLVHPTLGEVTRSVVVKVGEPARLSVDLMKK